METRLSPPPSATPPSKLDLRLLLTPAVIVGALGYFVDIYDLVLFQHRALTQPEQLGLSGDALVDARLATAQLQMAGMLLGGILWGDAGRQQGPPPAALRLHRAVFGRHPGQRLRPCLRRRTSVWRVLAGIGLAGELGGSMTLVSETLPKELRGYGTMIVATVGVFGAVVASLVADTLDWRTAYVVGGALGFGLLLLRVGVMESGMFEQVRARADVAARQFPEPVYQRGPAAPVRCCMLIGAPLWYVVGIVVTFCPEFARAMGVQGAVTGSQGILGCIWG